VTKSGLLFNIVFFGEKNHYRYFVLGVSVIVTGGKVFMDRKAGI